jgi:hypothetical protein
MRVFAQLWPPEINVAPRPNGDCGQFIWSHADHWTIALVKLIQPLVGFSPYCGSCKREARNCCKTRTRELCQRVKVCQVYGRSDVVLDDGVSMATMNDDEPI